MSHHAHRKTYSSIFRSDWVISDGQKRDDADTARFDSPVPSARIPSRASGESDRNASPESVKQERSSKTEPFPPKPRLIADSKLPKSRYSTFHANDWTVPGPPKRRLASSTAFKSIHLTLGATDHPDIEKRTQRHAAHRRWFYEQSREQDSTSTRNYTERNGSATRPSSAGSGYDAPPNPPSFAPTYSQG